MKLSPDQERAFATSVAWLRIRHSPFFYLAGFAGTGKSTIAALIAEQVQGSVRYAAFTGKAAKVMRSKGCRGASTIHSLIYDAFTDERTGMVKLVKTDQRVRGAGLIIIDECSMVGADLATDLLSFGIPVLVLGDPGQLPPVGGTGYFTAGRPDFMLEQIHRQAADSPILALATDVREGKFRREPLVAEGLTVCTRNELDRNVVPAAGAVLVGKNATRDAFNRRLREIKGFTGDTPRKGEMLMCLRNDRDKAIFNGEVFQVDRVKRGRKDTNGRVLNFDIIDPEDGGRAKVPVSVFEHFFQGKARVDELPIPARRGTQQFDYGYAMTCHKSQGSQWDDVVVFDESRIFREEANRWLYTAVTRAAKNLTLVL